MKEETDTILSKSHEMYDFWTPKTIEELAQLQGVEPISDVTIFYGTWPGELDDDFERFVQELRNINTV